MTTKGALEIIEFYSTLTEIAQAEVQLDFDNALSIIKQALAELEELKAKAHILTFSEDNEFVYIKGYGVYRKCDLEPENVIKIKIGSDKDE